MSSVLLLDIGSGTQDALYFSSGSSLENCPKFVLPSPAKCIVGQIRQCTREQKNIYLYGENMGGGFFSALKHHMADGNLVAAHPQAALALNDRPDVVRSWGIGISEVCPEGYVPIHLTDFDAGWWRAYLGMAGLTYPDRIVAAAQDHGVHSDVGNREGRFRLWEDLLVRHGGDPRALLYDVAPEHMTRLGTLQAAIGGGPVADTAAAAVLGALFVPEVAQRSWKQGITIINAGNSHFVAFLVFKERIVGVYEHHTSMLSPEQLEADLSEFRNNWLTGDQVRATGGHGCLTLDVPPEGEGFRRTYILGPQREMLAGKGTFLAPGGDMMLAGCFGLLKGVE